MNLEEYKSNTLDAKKSILELVVIILQPTIAGGMSEIEATRTFEEIKNSIEKVDESQHQFNVLLNDIINKWSLPIIAKNGVKIYHNVDES